MSRLITLILLQPRLSVAPLETSVNRRRYGERGMVHLAVTREVARENLIEHWDRERQASPGDTRIILTHTNEEVRELNEAARGRMRVAGSLGDDVSIKAERGERQFASGDRIMFLRNERGLGVKNGTLGIVEQVTPQAMAVTPERLSTESTGRVPMMGKTWFSKLEIQLA